MLILSRHIGQQIVIGDGADRVDLMVVDFRGLKVRLGFDAPRNIPVHRREIYDAILRKGGSLRSDPPASRGPSPIIAAMSSHALTLQFETHQQMLDTLNRGHCHFAPPTQEATK